MRSVKLSEEIKCSKCNLCKNANTVQLGGEGPEDADIMIIGEAPGADEDELGRPFIGQAGRYLRKHIFQGVGLDVDSIYMTNAVRCRPPGNKTPTKQNIRKCREHLVEEIKRVKPKVAILMGNVPLNSALYLDKVKDISKYRGKLMWHSEWNCWIMPTFHPSAPMRDRRDGLRWRYKAMIEDFEDAIYCSISRKKASSELPKFNIVTKDETLIRYLKMALTCSIVAVDIETDRLKPTNDILGMSLCCRTNGRYYPVYFQWSTLTECSDAVVLLTKLLGSEKVTKVFQNVEFDDKFLRFHGFKTKGTVYDTMIAAHLLDENFSTGLDANTWRYLKFGGYSRPLHEYKFENKFTKTTSYKKIPFNVLAPYAALDALATFQLWEVYEPKLRELQLWPLFAKILSPVRDVMTSASVKGIKVDVDRAKVLETRCLKAQDKLIEKVYEVAGREFNLKSPKELGKVLFDELGLKPLKKTKTGQFSTDADTIKYVARQKKKGARLARALQDFGYIKKMLSTYITPVSSNVWDDGRVHSSYNLAGTVTGRTSNAGPCTHNIPKDQLIRSLYTASPGCLLVDADIKGAELRAVALVSGEPVFLRAFEEGLDIHNMTYNTVFGKPDDYIPSQDERRLAKTINFGLIYGITPVGLAKQIGCTTDQARKFMDQYFRRLPRIKKFMDQVVKKAHREGYVKSLFKRRRRLPEINVDDIHVVRSARRKAQNATIQSSAADFTYIGLVRVAKLIKEAGLDATIIHTVHDCIIVDTPVHEVEDVKAIINKAFESPVKAFPIKMAVDIEVTKLWGEHNESKLETLLESLAA